jgi:hypothetical protein
MTRSVVVMAATVAFGALALPRSPAAEPTLKSVHLGESIYGPSVTSDQFTDAVVFVEHWGIHCGPGIGQVSHIVRWQDELADFGLVIVAAHRQKATPDEVRATGCTPSAA